MAAKSCVNKSDRGQEQDSENELRQRSFRWQDLPVYFFAIVTYMTRWDLDDGWAAKVIGESEEIQILLARYHEANDEFPEFLDDIGEDYTNRLTFCLATPTRLKRADGSITVSGRTITNCT